MSIRLFEPLVRNPGNTRTSGTIMRPGNGFALDVLSDWARGFEDRDGKFVEEFQTTFNSAFWGTVPLCGLQEIRASGGLLPRPPGLLYPRKRSCGRGCGGVEREG